MNKLIFLLLLFLLGCGIDIKDAASKDGTMPSGVKKFRDGSTVCYIAYLKTMACVNKLEDADE